MVRISFYLLFGSILFAWIGVSVFLFLLDSPSLCGAYFSLFLFLIAFLLAALLAAVILRDFGNHKIIYLSEVVILLSAALLTFCFLTNEYLSHRMYKSVSWNLETHLAKIADSFDVYLAKKGRLPDATTWCDSLLEMDQSITEGIFGIGQLPSIKCNFAFNSNLGNRSLEQLRDEGRVVLLVEVDGMLNESGTSELLNRHRSKNNCLSYIDERCIYLLFVDGTIGKYRLGDGKIALSRPPEGEEPSYYVRRDFTDWENDAQTHYLPLRWQ